MSNGNQYTNWAGNQTCSPSRRSTPTSTTEVAEIIGAAHVQGQRVKVVGAGHSFTDIAMTDGVLLSLDRFDQFNAVDRASKQVTVGAGIRLDALSEALHAQGLAMPNLGDIAVQSLAGAVSTATHGTGIGLGNLATTVIGFEIVTGTGEVLWCDPDHNHDVWSVGRASLGALGVITKIRLQCVDAFTLHAKERSAQLSDVMSDWSNFITSADHAELFFIPGGNKCLTKVNRRTGAAEKPPSKLSTFITKQVFENTGLDLALRAARRFPTQRDRVASIVEATISGRTLVDRSYRVFASPRRVRFREMEYAIPVDVLPEAIGQVQRMVADMNRPPLFPIEVRVSAADDIALSMAENRTSGWIAVHQDFRSPHEEYFRAVESIMNDYSGRPHWGKMHFQTHDGLAERYPQWDRFQAVRTQLDPHGVFRNAYLDRVLGVNGV